MANNIYDVIILGGGPAGLTAGIYLSRSKAKVLILDTGMIGGQMNLTHQIANYPGVADVSGFQLANNMKNQAVNFGCDIKTNVKISKLNLDNEQKSVILEKGDTFASKAIILAMGGKSRPLGVPGENDFSGRGISYCATCDGDFFQDKEIIVVGGGNSALEEAVALTTYASKVTILHEFDHFQAFDHAVKEAKSNPKIDYIMESHIIEFSGEFKLQKVKIKNLKTGKITEKTTDGVFIFIGYIPNTEILVNTKIELNERKEVISNERLQTNIKGVFVAGDSRAKRYRQITTAVADGTIAGLSALEYVMS